MISTKFFLKNSIIIMLLFAFTLTSCKKDDDDDDDPETSTFTVYKGTTALVDGHTFTFNTIDDIPAHIHLSVKNNSNSDIDIRIKVVSISNSNGNLFSVCLGSCFSGISVGDLFPANDFTIAAGFTQNEVTFHNQDDSGTGDKIFKFQIYEVGGSNQKFNFTYKYTH